MQMQSDAAWGWRPSWRDSATTRHAPCCQVPEPSQATANYGVGVTATVGVGVGVGVGGCVGTGTATVKVISDFGGAELPARGDCAKTVSGAAALLCWLITLTKKPA